MIKNEILKNSGLNEEMANEDREEVKKAVLTFLSMFPGTGFSFEEVRSKIGREFSSEDFEEVIADMILDGLLRGTSYSFFLTDKGRSQVEIKKKPVVRTGKQVVNNMEMYELMLLAGAMESEDWDDVKNPSSYDLTRFKVIVDEEGISKEYPEIKKFKKPDWVYFFKTAFSHL